MRCHRAPVVHHYEHGNRAETLHLVFDFPCAASFPLRMQYEKLYERSIKDPAGFWGDVAEQFHWQKKVTS